MRKKEEQKIKQEVINKLKVDDIHTEVYCDRCDKMIERQFRFTDWEDDTNDVFGDLDCCMGWYENAIEHYPKGRYSIYAVTICEDCDSILEDEGVLFNSNCPEYKD